MESSKCTIEERKPQHVTMVLFLPSLVVAHNKWFLPYTGAHNQHLTFEVLVMCTDSYNLC